MGQLRRRSSAGDDLGGSGRAATVLASSYNRAKDHLAQPFVADAILFGRVERITQNIRNRVGVRMLLACLLAKVLNPALDIRKPFTEIKNPETGRRDPQSYSGRNIDEQHIAPFIRANRLPGNSTTAFLTPSLRNRAITLRTDVDLVGDQPELYRDILHVFDAVEQGHVQAEELLCETIRQLIVLRDLRENRMQELIDALRTSRGAIPLSSEAIVRLIEQHLRFRQANARGAARLPVIIVASAYAVASDQLGEVARPLLSHNAADEQTGALGDVEITLVNDARVVTTYSVSQRSVVG